MAEYHNYLIDSIYTHVRLTDYYGKSGIYEVEATNMVDAAEQLNDSGQFVDEIHPVQLKPHQVTHTSLCKCGCKMTFEWSHQFTREGGAKDNRPVLYIQGHARALNPFTEELAPVLVKEAYLKDVPTAQLVRELVELRQGFSGVAEQLAASYNAASFLADGEDPVEPMVAVEVMKDLTGVLRTMNILLENAAVYRLDCLEDEVSSLRESNELMGAELDELNHDAVQAAAERTELRDRIERLEGEAAEQAQHLSELTAHLMTVGKELEMLKAANQDEELAAALVALAREEAA